MDCHLKRKSICGLLILLAAFTSAVSGSANEFLPADPSSEYLSLTPGEPTVDFCSEWNPEFAYRGYRCCSKEISRHGASPKRGRRNACAPNRVKWSFCDEMSDYQRTLLTDAKQGDFDSVLRLYKTPIGRNGNQSQCPGPNGFLYEGMPLIMHPASAIELRNPARCTNFGTDYLVATLNWFGEKVKKEYAGREGLENVHVVVGDMSAPKGGCISGRRGRRAHKSHTTGQDADIAFFNPLRHVAQQEFFSRTFFEETNWWMLKQLFTNPYACIKVAYVDRKLIRKLEKYVAKHPEEKESWQELHSFIRHIKGHRDHFHVRVGDHKGVPGCSEKIDLSEDQDVTDGDENDSPESITKKDATSDTTED